MKSYKKMIKSIYSLIFGIFIFYYCAKITIVFADYELTRMNLPGFWHTLRGKPLVLDNNEEDISLLNFYQKSQKIWEYIKKQSDNI
ncbi:MAG: hypothetical protein CEN89_254 [Candidatus Berkelbacteria bacterium Licking1014_7]|uniref:Uncharacterized protein n=1 Tax=Candidatus Berkelbacteria bacterium Licking1014_7 TaxID=2017147 RepID=A0A554LKG4_9BACT|nr:MAG: hypothetical protein CEN89_254 [Candidatus Berkelbacteria bacterium Licking1014_7]